MNGSLSAARGEWGCEYDVAALGRVADDGVTTMGRDM
jgi:hypothetical protein